MKKYLIIVIAGLLVVVGLEYKKISALNRRWEVAEANVKAYSEEMSAVNKRTTALQLTIGQLEYFNDSIFKALDDTRRQFKIKDKDLKALQQVSSSFKKKDTIRITQVDTLFKEPSLAIDTLLGDKWYTLRLGLKYPSMIAVEPQFKSEKHIVVSTKKETVDPPKKFFLLRWFQRKHLVLHVDVDEKNPYVEGESSKYVEIIK